MKDLIINDLSGNIYTYEQFLKLLSVYTKEQYNLYIGTDSKIVKNKVVTVSALCFHKPGSTGRVFSIRKRFSKEKYGNLRSRMFLEAYLSLELAMELESLTPTKIEIHLDVGCTIKSKTSLYEKELQALVLGQGYDCKVKPDSWCASAAADKVVNNQN